MRGTCLLALCFIAGALETLALQPPLFVDGPLIKDQSGQAVQLRCVSWTGAHMLDYVTGGLDKQHRSTIAWLVKQGGFNCVRLQMSVEMVFKNPEINPALLSRNRDLIGLKARDVYAALVDALAAVGVATILDMHMMDSEWCCNYNDYNGLWFNSRWSEKNVLDAWSAVAGSFKDNAWVIGADLRNELRITFPYSGLLSWVPLFPSWGFTLNPFKRDWAAAAERMGNTILDANPQLLIFVQGKFHAEFRNSAYPQTLEYVRNRPIKLKVDNRLVYSVHDYEWFHRKFDWPNMANTEENYNEWRKDVDRRWGAFVGRVPVWVGEFGTCHSSHCIDGTYWRFFVRYMQERPVHFAYWPLDGTNSRGTGRGFGDEEVYGLLNATWSDYVYAPLLRDLQSVMFGPDKMANVGPVPSGLDPLKPDPLWFLKSDEFVFVVVCLAVASLVKLCNCCRRCCWCCYRRKRQQETARDVAVADTNVGGTGVVYN